MNLNLLLRSKKNRGYMIVIILIITTVALYLTINKDYILTQEIDVNKIQQNLSEIHSQTDNITDLWLNGLTQDSLKAKVKTLNIEQLKDNDVSIYLYEQDSLKYWVNTFFTQNPNDIFTDPNQQYNSFIHFDDKKILVLKQNNKKLNRYTIVVINLLNHNDNLKQNIFGKQKVSIKPISQSFEKIARDGN